MDNLGFDPVGYEGELQLSQFDLQKTFFRELNFTRSESGNCCPGFIQILTFNFLSRNLLCVTSSVPAAETHWLLPDPGKLVCQAISGHVYLSCKVYLPCALIVVLSWVGFWLNREATSDRVTLGVTAVLTLSAISLDSRSDLPKVHYATALDWFIICSFLYCMASILEFAGVHYFTKVSQEELMWCQKIIFQIGSGESFGNDGIDSDINDEDNDEDWEDIEDWKVETPNETNGHQISSTAHCNNVEGSAARTRMMPNQTNHVSATLPSTMNHRPINPLNHNCISAYNNAYGINGSLSESSESVPVLPPPEYQVGTQELL